MTIEMDYAEILKNFKIHYSKLVKEFLTISKPHIGASILNTLKNEYANVIKSARASDYIDSLEDLLLILEKRNALSYDNIEPLKSISSTYVHDPALERSLRNYEECINNRPVVPLFNVYDIPDGKYIVDNLTRDTRLVILETSHIIDHNLTYNERTNHDVTNYSNNAGNLPGRIQSSAEDTLINETENIEQNNARLLIPERRYCINRCTIFLAKARYKIAGYRMTMMIALLGVFLIISLIKISNVKSSAFRYDARPGTSSRESQRHQIQAQMTLYATTQSVFHLTQPDSVDIGSITQSPDDDPEIARMVLLEISEKLGRHWRDVARFLGVRENDIDEINSISQSTLKEKALRALLTFQSGCDPLQWKTKLKRALEKARRRDLAEMVDELLSRKYRTN